MIKNTAAGILTQNEIIIQALALAHLLPVHVRSDSKVISMT